MYVFNSPSIFRIINLTFPKKKKKDGWMQYLKVILNYLIKQSRLFKMQDNIGNADYELQNID